MEQRMHDKICEIIQKSIEKKMCKAKTDEERQTILDKLETLDFSTMMKQMIKAQSGPILNDLNQTMYEQVLDFRAEEDEFLARQKQKWNKAFTSSEALYIFTLEFAEKYCDYVEHLDESTKSQKKYTFFAMQHIHGRALQIYLEIITLLKNGFADAAYSRWRTMYELAIVCDFISKYGENTAKSFYDSSETNEKYHDWAKISGAFSGRKPNAHITFKDLEEKSNLNTNAWNNQYQLANKTIHASPQDTFKRLSNLGAEPLIPVGRSDYGLTTPGEHSAITLVQITIMFGSLFADYDILLEEKILTDWIDIVRYHYFKAHDELFPNKNPLLQSELKTRKYH